MSPRRKKIIISTYDSVYNPYYRGGGAVALHTLAMELSKKFDVKIIAGSYPHCQDGMVDGVRYMFVGPFIFGPKYSQIVFHFELLRQIMTQKFDVWLESFTPPWSTSFLPLFSKSPVIGIAHMLSATDMGRKYGLPFHLVEQVGLKFYRFCVVVSPFQVGVLKRISPTTQTHLISNGVAIRRKNVVPLPKKKNQFLFLGRIEFDQKGIDILLQAFSRYIQHQKSTLIIAGSGNKQDIVQTQKLIENLGLSKCVHFVGYVEGERKRKLIRESLALVMASRYETYGMSALEAFSHGTSVIAPQSEYFAWLPKKASFRFAPENADSLSALMQFVSTHEQTRKRKELHGIHFAQQHTWKNSVRAYERVVERVLANSLREERLYGRGKIKRFLSRIWDASWENSRHLSFVFKDKIAFLFPGTRKS